VNATIMFGTDTSWLGMRGSRIPTDFRSLRYVLAGAEPVKESTGARTWKNSACAFSKAMASPRRRRRSPSTPRCSNKFGTVGRILPGMEARLEKVEGVDEGGRLFVRGAERDAGLPQGRESRRARTAGRRLA